MMEINDARHIEIFHTLEKIERLNRAIHVHQEVQADTDYLAIEQYERVKAQLVRQLLQLLNDMDVHLTEAAA